MINPNAILDEWVSVLSGVKELTAALGGSASIVAYKEGLASSNNLRVALLDQTPGSILIAWDGTTPRQLGKRLLFAHRFLFFARAAELSDSATYADIFTAFVGGKVGSEPWQTLLHAQIDPNCEPMDLDLPAAQRITLVAAADGGTIDCWQFQATLVESINPGGE